MSTSRANLGAASLPTLLATVTLLCGAAVTESPVQITYRDLVGLAGVPLVIALVQLVKTVWPELAPRWYPLAAIVCGLIVNLGGMSFTGSSPIEAAAIGVVVALVASGLYSQGRATAR